MCALASLPLPDLVFYYSMLCVHWRRYLYPIWVYVIVWCSPRPCTSPGYLGVGFMWSHVDLRSPAPEFVHNITCIRGIVPCSGSSSEGRWQLLYQGNDTCIWFWKTSLLQTEGIDDHPWGRIINCRNGRGCPDLFNRVCNHFISHPTACTCLHLRLMHWTLVGPH